MNKTDWMSKSREKEIEKHDERINHLWWMLTVKLKLYDIQCVLFFFPTIADNWNLQNCNIGSLRWISSTTSSAHMLFLLKKAAILEREKNTTKIKQCRNELVLKCQGREKKERNMNKRIHTIFCSFDAILYTKYSSAQTEANEDRERKSTRERKRDPYGFKHRLHVGLILPEHTHT